MQHEASQAAATAALPRLRRKGVRWLVALALLALALVAAVFCIPRWARVEPATPMGFVGSSAELKATQVVPTLDTPTEKGRNVIWCSSFAAAWQALAEEVFKGQIAVDGDAELTARLSQAGDPRPHLPPGGFYTAAGWVEDGVLERIRREFTKAFPAEPAPTFADLPRDSGVAYAYLQASVKFPLPYFQNRKPLVFTDSQGRTTPVSSFGIRKEDDYAYDQLRRQTQVLFSKGHALLGDLEFAVDLCATSAPSQIIVARIAPEPTLAAAVAHFEQELGKAADERAKASRQGVAAEGIGPNDVLLVPEFFWRLSHRFAELEGKTLTSTSGVSLPLVLAQQDIVFRLDRSGAELKSESKATVSPAPTHFVCDRPFLVCMRKRGDAVPYFVMWVDNAELLNRWPR